MENTDNFTPQPPYPQAGSFNTPGTPPSYSAGTPTFYLPNKPIFVANRRDTVLAIVLFLVSLVATNVTLYGQFHIGVTLGYCAILLCSVIYLWKATPTLSAYGIFCVLAALAGCFVFSLHNDGGILTLTYFGILFLTMTALATGTGTCRYDSGSIAAVIDVLAMLVARPITHMGTSIGAIFRKEQSGKIERRRIGGLLIGLLIAIPVLSVLIALLAGADAAFEAVIERLTYRHANEWIFTFLAASVLFFILYSRLFSLRHRLGISANATPRTHKGIDAIGINSFLGAISAVYLLYLLSQLAYFFSAFSGILPEDYTVAQYARRGFYEMCVVCAINLILVSLCLLLSRRSEGKAPLSTRLLCLFVLLFSLVLVAISLSKMQLYIQSFGMTRLRIQTSVFMAMMAVVLVSVGIRLFVPRFAYMRVCVVLISLLGLATAYIDVDTTIARYNVTAYQTGQLETVDTQALRSLSDGAVPYLLALQDDADETVAKAVNRNLYSRLKTYAEKDDQEQWIAKPSDWRSYNADQSRARRLLLENAQKISDRYFSR